MVTDRFDYIVKPAAGQPASSYREVRVAAEATGRPWRYGFSLACLARIALARASISAASASRPVLRYKLAQFSKLWATSGLSGPKAFFAIARARLYKGSASA